MNHHDKMKIEYQEMLAKNDAVLKLDPALAPSYELWLEDQLQKSRGAHEAALYQIGYFKKKVADLLGELGNLKVAGFVAPPAIIPVSPTKRRKR